MLFVIMWASEGIFPYFARESHLCVDHLGKEGVESWRRTFKALKLCLCGQSNVKNYENGWC